MKSQIRNAEEQNFTVCSFFFTICLSGPKPHSIWEPQSHIEKCGCFILIVLKAILFISEFDDCNYLTILKFNLYYIHLDLN